MNLVQPVGSAPRTSRRRVGLLRLVPAFREAVPEGERALAERLLTGARYELPAGPWEPRRLLGAHEDALAAVLLEGVIVQEVLLAPRASAGLLGPGEVFRPWRTTDTALPCSMSWTSTAPAAIAVLDRHFLAAARRWPALITALHERLADQLDAAARRTAITSLPRIEDRVVALFWHLADRWGTVGVDGVNVPIALTHDLIGRLTAAKRPTVSLALTTLAADGRLRRTAAGEWTLSHDSLHHLRVELDRRSEPVGRI